MLLGQQDGTVAAHRDSHGADPAASQPSSLTQRNQFVDHHGRRIVAWMRIPVPAPTVGRHHRHRRQRLAVHLQRQRVLQGHPAQDVTMIGTERMQRDDEQQPGCPAGSPAARRSCSPPPGAAHGRRSCPRPQAREPRRSWADSPPSTPRPAGRGPAGPAALRGKPGRARPPRRRPAPRARLRWRPASGAGSSRRGCPCSPARRGPRWCGQPGPAGPLPGLPPDDQRDDHHGEPSRVDVTGPEQPLWP